MFSCSSWKFQCIVQDGLARNQMFTYAGQSSRADAVPRSFSAIGKGLPMLGSCQLDVGQCPPTAVCCLRSLLHRRG